MTNLRIQRAVGHAALGFTAGLLLLPIFYLVVVRTQTATLRDPTWAWIFFLLGLGPAVALGVYGWMRGPTDVEP